MNARELVPIAHLGGEADVASRLEWPAVPAPARAAPSVRTVADWITLHPDTLAEEDVTQFKG
ncbi:hypothetical protein [Streptomyces flavofungini]|uniref:Uncharacterized protein n=1 Tax=Streptomyces flavofungini TaxID=68200 RepID=A0ABS0X4G6_9ACTN|nr:hypothetical protein [Streptomyces flavofungini]MBJ3808100.1 hypothetical protein [Streptomyces flavofungini]GHC56296.1 hypothetical protein GCM10010349_23640 [Streptomyces flavofungini]